MHDLSDKVTPTQSLRNKPVALILGATRGVCFVIWAQGARAGDPLFLSLEHDPRMRIAWKLDYAVKCKPLTLSSR